MEQHGLNNVFQISIEHILESEKIIRDKENRGSPDVLHTNLDEFWGCIDITSIRLKFECTKMSLIFLTPPLPSTQEVELMLGGTEEACLQFVATISKFNNKWGKTLDDIVTSKVIRAVYSTRLLLMDIQKLEGEHLKERILLSSAVAVEACKAFEICPRDDKLAVMYNLSENSQMITDAFEEMSRALVNDGPFHDDFGSLSDTEDNEERDEPKWSEQDKLTINPSINIIEAAKDIAQKLVTAVRNNGSCEEQKHIEELDQLWADFSPVPVAVDSLVEDIYPPVNVPNMDTKTHALASYLQTTVKTAVQSHVVTEDEMPVFEFMRINLDHCLTKLKDVLRTL